jgi:hypothetical protein
MKPAAASGIVYSKKNRLVTRSREGTMCKTCGCGKK